MSDNKIYTTKAEAKGGRAAGVITLSDNSTVFKMLKPKELGGEGADKGLNPEQLFAAAYSACFEGAIAYVSGNQKFGAPAESVSAEVDFLKREGGFSLAVKLIAKFKGLDQQTADKLMDAADKVCPYSHATRGNIAVTYKAIII